jgi:hypothetical protein
VTTPAKLTVLVNNAVAANAAKRNFIVTSFSFKKLLGDFPL